MGVPVTGTISCTADSDTYATIDPVVGIDGWRSVADHAARNAITTLRRREGMAVWTRSDGVLWVLGPAPWSGSDADWTEFIGGGITSLTIDGDASGSGSSTITLTVSSYNGGTAFGSMAAQASSAVAITGGTITGLPTPSAGSDAATKSYADALISGFSPRTSCQAGTTTALTATYSNGTLGVGATLTNSGSQAAFSVDGVTPSVNDRILVKDQATPAQNGIYTLTTVGSGSTNWVLTRATDYDQAADVSAGTYTVLVAGTANAGSVWFESAVGPFTIGTTAIVWTRITVGGISTTLTGNVTGTGSGTIATTIASNVIATAMLQNSAVTLAKIANVPGSRLLGNPGGSAAAPSAITLGSGLSFSGSSLVATGTGGTVTSVATGAGLTGGPITSTGTVSLATIATHQVLANTTGGTAAPSGVTLTSLLDAAISSTRGSILYRSASAWSALGPGAAGNVLTTHGASADPTWGSSGGSGTVTSVATGAGLTGGPITSTGTIALASIANNTILANVSGLSAAPSATTLTAILDSLGTAQGTVIFRGASGWAVLPPGTSGNVLTTHGAAADPTWTAASGGSGTVTSIACTGGITCTPTNPITTTGTILLASITDGNLLANVSGSALNPSGTTLTAYLDHVLGTTQGLVPQRGASAWGAVAGFPGSHAFGVSGTPALNATTPPIFLDRAATCDGLTIAAGTAPSGGSLTVQIQTSTDGTTWSSLTSGSVSATTGNYSGTAACTTAISANTYVRGKFTAVNGAADAVATLFIRS